MGDAVPSREVGSQRPRHPRQLRRGRPRGWDIDLYPAIDLRAGRCVRLYQGDYGRETVYGTDPVSVAQGFAAAGASWIHVVDLDAARTGVPENRDAVAAVAAAVAPDVAVQSGGGVRSEDAALALVAGGVRRVVLGTAAIEDPGFVRKLAAEVPVAVGIDVRGREAAVRGWTEGSGVDLADALHGLEDAGVEAVIVTHIARDGTLEGPDLEGLADVLDTTELAVVASGGVGTLGHLEALASLEASGRTLSGVIVGRALYERTFTLEEALAVCRRG